MTKFLKHYILKDLKLLLVLLGFLCKVLLSGIWLLLPSLFKYLETHAGFQSPSKMHGE